MDPLESYYLRRQREQLDRQARPGRQGQATVGHFFLTRPALTKANPYFDSVVSFDEEGVGTVTSYAHYGVSTYGDSDVYAEEL